MKKIKIYSLLLVLTILATSVTLPIKTEAASKKITVEEFVILLVKAMKLEVDKTLDNPYIEKAKEKAIIRNGEFKNIKANLTRTDAAVLANRADEELHGNTVTVQLLDMMLEKRISDITKIPKSKREDVAKIMSKGIIKGYFNGYYVQNREFRGNNLISKSGAKSVIDLVINPERRAPMSPDGQPIRTTNLPKEVKSQWMIDTGKADKEYPYRINKFPSYKDYPYILEAFPNEFYQQGFRYHRTAFRNKLVELIDYARPSMIHKIEYKNDYFDTQKAYALYKYDWMEKVERNLKTRLNVDYRTIDNNDTWFENLRTTYYIMRIEDSTHNSRVAESINDYIKYVKENKIIIKADKIAVEPSTLYFADGNYVRVYVKFKVSAKDMSRPGNLIYDGAIFLNGLEKNKWIDCIFDVALGTRNGNSDGRDYGVFRLMIEDLRLLNYEK